MSALADWRKRPMKGVDPLYPSSDGKPMAEGSLQYRWITTLQGNLELLFRDRNDVFVAADNLVYPVEGDPTVCQAPDVYVAFGVEKVHRGSFIVHQEGGVFPQVVFEVWSPSNTAAELARKLIFYDQYGAEEYYEYDPKRDRLRVYWREEGRLVEQPNLPEYVSHRLDGVRFDTTGPELVVYHPDGRRFLTRMEAEEELANAQREFLQARREREQAERQAAAAAVEAARLRELLRQAGIDPDAAR